MLAPSHCHRTPLPGAVEYRVEGYVRDREGRPIEGASLLVLPREPLGYPLAATLEEGSYHLDDPGVSPGPATIMACAPGYLPADKPVVIDLRRTARVDFVLHRGPNPDCVDEFEDAGSETPLGP